MPGYTYVAVDEKGKEKRGRMDAENRDAVSQQLKKDGLFPVEIKEQGDLNKDIDFSIGKKVKPRDLSVFCRQFVSITQKNSKNSNDNDQFHECKTFVFVLHTALTSFYSVYLFFFPVLISHAVRDAVRVRTVQRVFLS